MTRRRSPRGFIIIWGSRNVIRNDGTQATTTCPYCHKTALLIGKKTCPFFTLYFIPIFPIGATVRFVECTSCRSQFTGMDLAALQAAPAADPYQDAIMLYNQLRENPRDAAKLEAVLRIYGNTQSWSSVVAAAKDFPEALETSDTCLVLAAYSYHQLGREADAQRHYAAALALNPNNAHAQQALQMAPA